MLYFRRFLLTGLCVSLCLSAAVADGTSNNSSTASPAAVKLLLQAQMQFQNLDFVPARKNLWKAYQGRDDLSPEQQKMLTQKLGEVDQAIRDQVIARSMYSKAVDEMKAGHYNKAQKGFALAASCPYLSMPLRHQAQENLAKAEKQMAMTLAKEPVQQADQPVSVEAPLLAAVSATTSPKELAAAPVKKKATTKKKAVAEKAASKDDSPMTALQKRQLQIDLYMSKGQEALKKNQPEAAAAAFGEVLKLDPDNEKARRQLDYAQKQTASSANTGLLSIYRKQKEIQLQMAVHDYNTALARAMELMAKADSDKTFEAAEHAAQSAKNVVESNRRLFPNKAYRDMIAKADSKLQWIKDKKHNWNIEKVKESRKAIIQAEKEREIQAQWGRNQKIAELTRTAHSLGKEEKWEEMLEVMKEIAAIDPNNVWVQQNIPMLQTILALAMEKKAVEKGKYELHKLTADILHSSIPWYDRIRYPRDWKERSKRRLAYSAEVASEPEANRRVKQELEKLVNFNMQDTKFQDVISEYFRDVYGLNMFVNWAALEMTRQDIKEVPINMNLRNVALGKVLTMVLQSAGGGEIEMGYTINEGVIEINTLENLNQKMRIQVYDIRDLLARVPNFVGPRVEVDAIGSGSTGSSSSSSSSSSSGDSLFVDSEDENRPEDNEEDLLTKAEMIKKLIDTIQSSVDKDSWDANGGTAQINELSGNLVVTQTSQNHQNIQNLIEQLRESRTIQVSVEARFITVNSGYLSEIGVDLDIYFNIGSNINTLAPTPWATAPAPPTGSQWSAYNPSPQMSNFSPIGVTNDSARQVSFVGATNPSTVPGGILTWVNNPAMSIAGTFLDDIQVDFLINATQGHQSTRVLTAPRITLYNGQRAYVSVATQQAYVSGIDPVVSDNVGVAAPIISYAPTGTMLDVDVTVSHDRRYVTMTLRPQVVNLISLATVDYGGVPLGLPQIRMQDIQTTVSIPDGGTLLIGGQKLSDQQERELGAPVLSKLPVLNRMTSNKSRFRDEQTLLILVKPQIIIQDEVEKDESIYVEDEPFSRGIGVN